MLIEFNGKMRDTLNIAFLEKISKDTLHIGTVKDGHIYKDNYDDQRSIDEIFNSLGNINYMALIESYDPPKKIININHRLRIKESKLIAVNKTFTDIDEIIFFKGYYINTKLIDSLEINNDTLEIRGNKRYVMSSRIQNCTQEDMRSLASCINLIREYQIPNEIERKAKTLDLS